MVNPNRLRYHDRSVSVHGRLNFYDSNKSKANDASMNDEETDSEIQNNIERWQISNALTHNKNKLKNEHLKCSIECKTGPI